MILAHAVIRTHDLWIRSRVHSTTEADKCGCNIFLTFLCTTFSSICTAFLHTYFKPKLPCYDMKMQYCSMIMAHDRYATCFVSPSL